MVKKLPAKYYDLLITNLPFKRKKQVGSLLCSLLPVLLGLATHASECYTFLSSGPTEDITLWQGYPYSVLCYGFLLACLQVHAYQIYFANCLMQAWLPTVKEKPQ